MMSLAIIEDEFPTRELLRTLIEEHFDWIEVCGEADSVKTGLQLIREKAPDVMLLDVEMQDGLGFDLLDALKGHVPIVIFVTAYRHYSIKAIRQNALDYLEKPVDPEELANALLRAKKQWEVKRGVPPNPTSSPALPPRIVVPTKEGARYIECRDIAVVKADGSYTEIQMVGTAKPFVVSRKLKELQSILEPMGFIRPNHSYLINMSMVVEVRKADGGTLVLKNGLEVTLSKHYKREALDRLNDQAQTLG